MFEKQQRLPGMLSSPVKKDICCACKMSSAQDGAQYPPDAAQTVKLRQSRLQTAVSALAAASADLR